MRKRWFLFALHHFFLIVSLSMSIYMREWVVLVAVVVAIIMQFTRAEKDLSIKSRYKAPKTVICNYCMYAYASY